MKSVVICGSGRYKPEIEKFAQDLRSLGVVVFEPYLHRGGDEWNALSAQYKQFVALGLTHEHFHKIELADVVFIYNKDGYSGNSTTLEIGYAVATKKPIYAFSDQDEELCRSVLFRGFYTDPETLVTVLK